MPDLREELIQTLHAHLAGQKYIQEEAGRAAMEQREEMVANRAKHLRHKANLLQAIREEGGCRSLYEDLKDVEGKWTASMRGSPTGIGPSVKPIARDEVREFVNGHFPFTVPISIRSNKHASRG